jgi:hypothetical protein
MAYEAMFATVSSVEVNLKAGGIGSVRPWKQSLFPLALVELVCYMLVLLN